MKELCPCSNATNKVCYSAGFPNRPGAGRVTVCLTGREPSAGPKSTGKFEFSLIIPAGNAPNVWLVLNRDTNLKIPHYHFINNHETQ